MEEKQRKNMLWRIPLVVAILVAIFWGIWYLSTGEVPVTSQIRWTEETTIQLPFSISRIWDIPFAFIWTFVLILLFTHKKIKDDENLVPSLVTGLGVGLVFGLGVGLGVGLVFGLGVGLVFGLIFGLVASLGVGLVSGLVPGLVTGLAFGLVTSLVPGLVAGLVFGLVASLGVGLSVGLKFIFSEEIWKKTGQWIIGK
ncbi:MAG: hypothetical protein GF387_01010 [Candidatus Portnoybacteria bacterium]|nr:hypothetical protein [Candidatus Portnoybacteria bacterium]